MHDHMTERGTPLVPYAKHGPALTLRGYACLVGCAIAVGAFVAAVTRGWI